MDERSDTAPLNARYPRTPYWPHSPFVGRDGGARAVPERFVGAPVVATEKLDGANTLLHRGEVYGRGVSAPNRAGWTAMARKHHAWKVTEPDVFLYGEDVYGVHAIAYDPVPEDRTFHAFALRRPDGAFAPFAEVEAYAERRRIPVVPVLFRGRFESTTAIRAFLERAHGERSALGGEREGVVLRLARGFPASEFGDAVCKSVRVGHVQSDAAHWTRNWRRCRLLPARGPGAAHG